MSQSLPDGQKEGYGESIPDTGNYKYKSLKIIRILQVHLQIGCLWDGNKCPVLRSGISRGQAKTGVTCPAREGLRECRHKLLEVTIKFLRISVRISVRVKMTIIQSIL